MGFINQLITGGHHPAPYIDYKSWATDSMSIFRERQGMPTDTFPTIGQALSQLSHHCDVAQHAFRVLRPNLTPSRCSMERGYETRTAQRLEGGHCLWTVTIDEMYWRWYSFCTRTPELSTCFQYFSANSPKKHFLGSIISVTGMTRVLLADEDQHHKPSTIPNSKKWVV